MSKLIKPMFCLVAFFFLMVEPAWAEEEDKRMLPALTHADAAIIFAKFSGFFDRYVEADAGLNQCVAFLNRTGVYFGLLEVVNGSEFSVKDAAMALGQIHLILNGEAEFSSGKVKLPERIESWEDYCIMSGVEYILVHQTMREMLQMAAE